MSWQSGSINPATTSPLADIGRIKNDLSVLKGVLGGTQDADVPFTPYAWPSARIVGDFSSTPISNRVMFKTSTVNGHTSVGAIPNGTSTASHFTAFSASDPANSSYAQLSMTGVEARLQSSILGSGTYLPMTFYTGGTERMRIDTSGNVLVMSASGGLGYGIGAGGTVTQSTSKSTAVTLNKPCGQITMNNAALAAGAEVSFTVNNTLVTESDLVLISPLWAAVNPFNYQCRITYVGANTLGIAVKNISAGSLSEALVINFAVIKGSTS